MSQNRIALWIAFLATLVSVGVLGYLTLHHYELLLGIASGKGICNIGKFDCDAVNTSSYSEFLGRAIALWGAAFNAFLALMILWHAMSGNDRLARLAFLLSVVGAGVSVVMGAIANFQIGVFCLFCATVYATSFITAISLWLYSRKMNLGELGQDIAALFKRGPEGAFSVLVTGVIVAVVPVFIVHDMIMTQYGKDFEWAIPDSFRAWQAAPEHKFSEEGALTKGAAADKAVLTITEFADFRCPHCKHAVPSLHSFVKSHPDVRLIFLNFPLDSGCNPAMEHPGQSCGLAKAVYCANKAGKGWEAHDYLFDNQGRVTPADLSGLISAAGLNADELKSCMESTQTHDAILAQAAKGKEAGVEGTPAIYVNGKNLPKGFLIPILDAVYRDVKK